MARRTIRYLRSNALGLAAIAIALSGTAIAASTAARDSVTSKSIKNETIKGKDVKNDSLTGAEVKNDSLTGGDISEASLEGLGAAPSGPAGGALTGTYPNPQLAAPGVGARAFGSVAADGTLSASKNATVSSHPENGVYCITAAASVGEPRVLIASIAQGAGSATLPDQENFGFAIGSIPNTFVGDPCPVGAHQVTTLVYNGDGNDDDGGVADSTGDELILDDEPFIFVIP